MPRLSLVLLLVSLATPALAEPPPGPPPPPEMREGRDARLLEAVRRADPGRYDKLVAIREAKPRMYRTLLASSLGPLRGRGRDAEGIARFGKMIDATFELHQKLDAWAAARGKARDRLGTEIEATVGTLFELRQEVRRAQVAQMQTRLKQLEGEIEARDERKDELVEEFTRRMLGALDAEPGF